MEELYQIELQLQERINVIYSAEAVKMKKSFLERIKDLF